jgi:acetyl esterase
MPIFEYDKKKLAEHRDFILGLQQKEKRSAVSIKDVKILLLPSSCFLKSKNNLFIIIYRSIHLENPPYPTLLHIRGTGYNTSARYYSYITCSHLARKSGCQVIDIDHSLAPEDSYKTIINEVHISYKSIIDHSSSLQIDVKKIAISGYSSGGNLAALAAIQAKKYKLPLSLQILISPITDLSRSLKKFRYFENRDSFPSALALWFIDLFLQDNSVSKDSIASPFWSNDLAGLPPTYFLFGEFDRFRSDSEAYADKLRQFGVWTHKSMLKNEKHSMFWLNIHAIEVIAIQLRMGLNLTKIMKPIPPIFFERKNHSPIHSILEKTIKPDNQNNTRLAIV